MQQDGTTLSHCNSRQNNDRRTHVCSISLNAKRAIQLVSFNSLGSDVTYKILSYVQAAIIELPPNKLLILRMALT